jgi:hypothetical protein
LSEVLAFWFFERFRPLPTWAEQRITAAPEAQLDTWLDGIYDGRLTLAITLVREGS